MTTTVTPYIQTQGRGHFSQRVLDYESSTTVDSFHNGSTDYWCDTCDKGFRTKHHLENHQKAHQKCNIDGCQFIAHPNVITKHIQMQHSTGLYKKICKLNDPEEIKKWREERKKKYPTKVNIEKKAAQIKEKVARGEKMGIHNNRGHRKPFKSDHSSIQKSKSSFRNPRNRTYEKKIENKSNDRSDNKPERPCKITLPPTELSRTLKPFGGIQHLIFENDDLENEPDTTSNDLIEEDEYVSDTPNMLEQSEKTAENNVCGALTSLICNYGSSDDEENSDIIENKTIPIRNKTNEQNTLIKSTTDNNSNINKHEPNTVKEIKDNSQPLNANINSNLLNDADDDSGPEETKIVKEQIDIQQNNLDEQNNKAFKKLHKPKLSMNLKSKSHFKNNTYRRKLPSTLLEKLLHREIQKERNIVLQCIRHIVKNNYFDTSSKE